MLLPILCSGSTDWSIRRDPIVDFVHSTRVRQKQRYFRGYSRRFARCNFLSFPTYSTRRFKIQTVSRRFIARGKCNVHASVDGLDLSSSPLESPLGHLIKTVEYPCEIRKTDIRVTSLPLGFLQGERKKKGGRRREEGSTKMWIDSPCNETLVVAAVSHRNAIYRTFLTSPGWSWLFE